MTRGHSTTLSTQHACGACRKQHSAADHPDLFVQQVVCLKCKRTSHKIVDCRSAQRPFPNAQLDKEKKAKKKKGGRRNQKDKRKDKNKDANVATLSQNQAPARTPSSKP